MSARRYISPLRYPGGKAPMARWLSAMLDQQTATLGIEVWLEPFAGGAGAGLSLLDSGAIAELWLVDNNPAIAAFWEEAVTHSEAFANRIERITPDLAVYDAAREILAAPATVERDELALATFIVNRCSRSGIVAPTSGPIGGRKQDGAWTIASRWNGAGLADRIRHLGALSPSIRTHHGDGIAFLRELDGSGIEHEVIAFVDPPYLREGNRLYTSGFGEQTHRLLAETLNAGAYHWMLTYDDEPAVADTLYPDRRVLPYEIRNTTNRARVAREFAVFSDRLHVPSGALINGRGRAWVRAA